MKGREPILVRSFVWSARSVFALMLAGFVLDLCSILLANHAPIGMQLQSLARALNWISIVATVPALGLALALGRVDTADGLSIGSQQDGR